MMYLADVHLWKQYIQNLKLSILWMVCCTVGTLKEMIYIFIPQQSEQKLFVYKMEPNGFIQMLFWMQRT